MDRPFILMQQPKVGYLDGKRREFAAGEVYQVDETLYKAFVVDLKIADPFDPRAGAPVPVATEPEPAPAADAGGDEPPPPKTKGKRRGK